MSGDDCVARRRIAVTDEVGRPWGLGEHLHELASRPGGIRPVGRRDVADEPAVMAGGQLNGDPDRQQRVR